MTTRDWKHGPARVAGFFLADPEQVGDVGIAEKHLHQRLHFSVSRLNKKGPHRCGPCCIWLPDLGSNQGHTD